MDFKLLSLNARGIRSATKWKAIFTWLNKRRYDIIFLQETYSTVDVEYIWRTQWRGKLFFAHDSIHSCGVMILVRSDLDFNPRTITKFNASLVNDDDFVALINESVPV